MKRQIEFYKGITIKFYEQFQFDLITKTLSEIEQKGFPIAKIKYIQIDEKFIFPGFYGYQWKNGIHLNHKKIRNYKSASRIRKRDRDFFWLVIHELIHILDRSRKSTKYFLEDYWLCLDKVRENIGSKLFQYKNRKSVFKLALPAYRKLKKFDPYRRYDKRVRKISGAPNTYSLMAPYEFVAELFSFYAMRRNSIPNKLLLKKVEKYFLENIKQ